MILLITLCFWGCSETIPEDSGRTEEEVIEEAPPPKKEELVINPDEVWSFLAIDYKNDKVTVDAVLDYTNFETVQKLNKQQQKKISKAYSEIAYLSFFTKGRGKISTEGKKPLQEVAFKKYDRILKPGKNRPEPTSESLKKE